MRLRYSLVWATAAIAVGLFLPAWLALGDHPDLAVRSRPLRTHGGRIHAVAAPGQRFLCDGPGLKQIDVALVSIREPNVDVELVLREENSRGTIVRRAIVSPESLIEPEFVPFRFDPVQESSGRWYHFELFPAAGARVANHSIWIRFHGRVGRDDAWGDQVLESRNLESSFEAPADDLRAIAIACEDLSNARGEFRLELWEPGKAKQPLRQVRLAHPILVESGYAFFAFEPIVASAGRTYSLRVTSRGVVRFNGRNHAPTFKTYHGLAGSTPGLGGITADGHPRLDRDLVFRTWTSSGRLSELNKAYARAGWRMWAAGLSWTLSVLALVRLGSSAAAKPTCAPQR